MVLKLPSRFFRIKFAFPFRINRLHRVCNCHDIQNGQNDGRQRLDEDISFFADRHSTQKLTETYRKFMVKLAKDNAKREVWHNWPSWARTSSCGILENLGGGGKGKFENIFCKDF